MKRVLNFVVLVLTAMLLLSACATNYAVRRPSGNKEDYCRQYGYYIVYSSDRYTRTICYCFDGSVMQVERWNGVTYEKID